MICVAGKNSIAVNIASYIMPSCVVLNKDDAGVDTWQPSLGKWAKNSDTKITSIDSLYDDTHLIFISAEYDALINPELFKPTAKLFNIHFSDLPKYRGAHTSIHPILNGEMFGGVTIHYIDNGIDTGPIIAQKTFVIDINDTARDLYFKYPYGELFSRFCYCLLHLYL